MASLKKLLEKTTVESLVNTAESSREVVEISSTLSVAEGFKKLLDNNVLSAPVYDVEARSYVGFLDLRDLVSWAVFLFDEQESTQQSDVLDIINAGPKFFKQFTGDLSRRNPFHAVREGSSLAEVAAILRLGVKRVPVLNSEGRVVGIISQSALNRFLFENNKALKGDTSLPLSGLVIGRTPVLHVKIDTPAIETFRLMDNKHISGVAVCDNEGRVVANTSSRDLKGFIKNPRRSILQLPMSEFLAQIRKKDDQSGAGGGGVVVVDETPVITCRVDETLATAMGQIATTNVHRIYVLDPNHAGVPQRVITLTDIMKYIA